MTKEEKEIFCKGYQGALRDCLDDLVLVHQAHQNNEDSRKVVDEVWEFIKRRVHASKLSQVNRAPE